MLKEALAKLARDEPSMRKHLVPILRKADDRVEVGKILLQQLGGSRRLKAMIGARGFLYLNTAGYGLGGIKFDFPRPGRGMPNSIQIWLDPDDTYTMQFGSKHNLSWKKLKELKGVYAEDLKRNFEKATGLYLSL